MPIQTKKLKILAKTGKWYNYLLGLENDENIKFILKTTKVLSRKSNGQLYPNPKMVHFLK